MNYKFINKNSQGYIVLISVLIIGVVAIAITTSILFFGASSSRMLLSVEELYKTKALANACAEQALEELRQNNNLANGEHIIYIDEGSCEYTLIVGTGDNRTLQIVSEIRQTFRKTEIIVDQLKPTINVSSWKEVTDF